MKLEKLKHFKTQIAKRAKGAAAPEYGIILASVSIVAISAVYQFGIKVDDTFTSVASGISSANIAQAESGESGLPFAPFGEGYAANSNIAPGAMLMSVSATDTRNWARIQINPTSGPVTIDWGDGSPAESYGDWGWKTHTYAASGAYDISIDGGTDVFYYYSLDPQNPLITHLHTFGNQPITSLQGAFSNTTALEYVAPLPATVDRLASVFYNSTSNPAGLDAWDVTNVLYFDSAFYNGNGNSTFTTDLSGWCVDDITDEPYQFDDGSAGITPPNWGAAC